MTHGPAVSVVMPVYNGERFLQMALDSLWQQTFEDFELVLVDDGSTDATPDIVSAHDDPRLRVLRGANQGIIGALNTGLAAARGRYVARMDADDVSTPERFERQVGYLDTHPWVGLVGSSYELLDESGRHRGRFWALTEDKDIRREFFIRNPFGHGTVMMRRDVAALGYRPGTMEDLDLWMRAARSWRLANLPEVLYYWRVNPGGITLRDIAQQAALKQPSFDELWTVDAPGALSPLELTLRLRRHRAIGAGFGDQFIADQYGLALAMLARGHRGPGLAQLASVFVVAPTAAPIVWTFLAKDPGASGLALETSLPEITSSDKRGYARRWFRILTRPSAQG